MNELITDVFGDPYITLDCASGECLAESQVPGYTVSLCIVSTRRFNSHHPIQRPPKKGNKLLLALSAAGGGVICLLTFLGMLSTRSTKISGLVFQDCGMLDAPLRTNKELSDYPKQRMLS